MTGNEDTTPTAAPDTGELAEAARDVAALFTYFNRGVEKLVAPGLDGRPRQVMVTGEAMRRIRRLRGALEEHDRTAFPGTGGGEDRCETCDAKEATP